jgi:hypothetical protein
MRIAALIVAAVLPVVLAGCPSKEGEQKDANAGMMTNGGPPASGPLAGLESAPFMNEVWNMQGQQTQILYYSRENVRVSGQCRNPAGQLGCAALQQVRGAPPVMVGRGEMGGGKPAGVVACTKLGNQLALGVNPNGNEEQFCRFRDGSLLSTNSLEQYGVRIQ